MGNDGGTIPTRREILGLLDKTNNSWDKETQLEQQEIELLTKLTKCAISGEDLTVSRDTVVVSDYKGNLYDKEKIIEHLLTSSTTSDKDVAHIKSLNDLVEVRNYHQEITTGAGFNEEEMGKKTDCCYLVPCGCLNDMKLVKQITFDLKNSKQFDCPKCGTSTSKRDIIGLRTIEENEERFKLISEQNLFHNLKSKFKSKPKSKQKKNKVMKGEKNDTRKKTNLITNNMESKVSPKSTI